MVVEHHESDDTIEGKGHYDARVSLASTTSQGSLYLALRTRCQPLIKVGNFLANGYRRLLQPFMISPDSRGRMFWNAVVSMLLIYIGTIFPYRLCFIEFRMEANPEL